MSDNWLMKQHLERIQDELYKREFEENLKQLKESIEPEEKVQKPIFKKVVFEEEVPPPKQTIDDLDKLYTDAIKLINNLEEENKRLKEVINSQHRTFEEIKELLRYHVVMDWENFTKSK